MKKSRFGKDPTVETSFLPDKDREIKERAQREQLKQEWLAKQERIKKERLNVTYSYWDGSGHRREIIIPKGGCRTPPPSNPLHNHHLSHCRAVMGCVVCGLSHGP